MKPLIWAIALVIACNHLSYYLYVATVVVVVVDADAVMGAAAVAKGVIGVMGVEVEVGAEGVIGVEIKDV